MFQDRVWGPLSPKRKDLVSYATPEETYLCQTFDSLVGEALRVGEIGGLGFRVQGLGCVDGI